MDKNLPRAKDVLKFNKKLIPMKKDLSRRLTQTQRKKNKMSRRFAMKEETQVLKIA